MKKLLGEFRDFINRGNVMDLAVGVIIGGAFTAIVTALTTNIINPLIALIGGGDPTQMKGLMIPGTQIDIGSFVGAIINFLIVAVVVFFLVKAVNNVQNIGSKVSKKVMGKDGKEMKEEPPVCPFCLEEVKVGATRCPHCAGELPEPAKAKLVEA